MSFLVELPQNEFNPDAFAGFAPTGGVIGGNALANGLDVAARLRNAIAGQNPRNRRFMAFG
jgi:hypothetical protein